MCSASAPGQTPGISVSSSYCIKERFLPCSSTAQKLHLVSADGRTRLGPSMASDEANTREHPAETRPRRSLQSWLPPYTLRTPHTLRTCVITQHAGSRAPPPGAPSEPWSVLAEHLCCPGRDWRASAVLGWGRARRGPATWAGTGTGTPEGEEAGLEATGSGRGPAAVSQMQGDAGSPCSKGRDPTPLLSEFHCLPFSSERKSLISQPRNVSQGPSL